LIVGAGIAGPTLAFWLSAAGFEPTLIEHAPRLRAGGYVIDFWGLGYDIAERMGLRDEIECLGYHIREMRILDGDGKRLAGLGTSVFRELTGGRFVTLRRSDLSRLLSEKVMDRAEVLLGEEVVDLSEGIDGVRVRLKQGGERRFDLVIGADGLHSRIRHLVFGPQARFEKPLGYAVAAFEAADYRPRDEDAYVIYGEPGWMLGRFALRDDRTLFLLVFATDIEPTSTPRDRLAQTAMLRQRYGAGKWECPRILGALERAPEVYFDRVSQIKLDRWSKGRVALVGDAAYCVSLMAGQGAALAMTGAYVLAGELAKAGRRYEDAFASYEGLLRSWIVSKQRGAERYAAAFAPKTQWGLFLRNQVIRACAIPGLARLTFGRDIIDTLKLPEYRWPYLGNRAGSPPARRP
jgi:2-polyprenyl-6-methoxyphenol hydroxylase-like FAD-dependent oxidoreductase